MRTAVALLTLAVLLVPPAAAMHSAPASGDEVSRLARDGDVTWRAVDFYPSEQRAVMVGGYDAGDNETRSLVAVWTPNGTEEVYNRSGPPLVDVDVREDGRHLIVGLRDTILVGRAGNYTDVWDESRFAGGDRDLTFYGLGAAWATDGGFGLVSGSSLLRVESDGSLEVVHSGEGAFFRSIDFNPVSEYALVEAAIQQDSRTVLGTIWRTNGFSNLTQEDNVAIYGRFDRGNALLNAVSFAPNGTFALFSGRDGSGASFLSWSVDRTDCHRHPENTSRCHDHTYQYLGTSKPTGPTTCVDWHPSGKYALVTGLEEDVVGFADAKMWAPLMHQGPDLFGCAMGPDGERGLAVGANGTVLEVRPGSGPLVRVLDPQPGRLAPPNGEQRFLVGVLERAGQGLVNVTGSLAGNETVQRADPHGGSWWTLSVNASHLEDGRHELVVNASQADGRASTRFLFVVNNDAFSPSTPSILPPRGLEGDGQDSDGLFTIRWEPLDEPVVYEVEQQTRAGGANTTKVLEAGSSPNATVRVTEDGTYRFRVRAANSYATGNWSEATFVEVVLDSDGDGVPDERDPQPHTRNAWGDPDEDGIPTNQELKQCSDPYDPNSTPTSDDDGDGIPNGIECEQGTDPRDPNDPPPDEPEDPEPSTNDSTDPDDGSSSRDTPGPGLGAVFLVIAGLAWARRES